MIETRRTTFTQLELAASGIVDRHDVRRAAEALGSALDGDGRARLLIDLRAVEDITMKAFASDLEAGARLVPRLRRLQRVAVVGDVAWLRTLERVRESMLPQLQVRTFGADELDAARTWLAAGASAGAGDAVGSPAPEASAAPSGRARSSAAKAEDPGSDAVRGGGPPGFDGRAVEGLLGAAFEAFTGQRREARQADPGAAGEAPARESVERVSSGLRASRSEEDGLVTLVLDGRIRASDIEAAAAYLDAPAGGDVRLLARLVRFEGIEPAALMSPALWRLQKEGLSRVRRAALVTSIEWLGRMIESAARLQSVEVRTFAPGRDDEARAWLNDVDGPDGAATS